jgi:hypothetical protein
MSCRSVERSKNGDGSSESGVWSTEVVQQREEIVLVGRLIACITQLANLVFANSGRLLCAQIAFSLSHHFLGTPPFSTHTFNGRRKPNSTGPCAPKARNPQNVERGMHSINKRQQHHASLFFSGAAHCNGQPRNN